MAFAGEHRALHIGELVSKQKDGWCSLDWPLCEGTRAITLIMVKSSRAEVVIYREDLAHLMQQQQILLESRDMKSTSEEAGRAKAA